MLRRLRHDAAIDDAAMMPTLLPLLPLMPFSPLIMTLRAPPPPPPLRA